MKAVFAAGVVGAAALIGGCGSASNVAARPSLAPIAAAPTSASPSPSAAISSTAATPSGRPSAAASKPPHFDTPQAAMTYLAAAWNADNLVDLKHVTNPDARQQLNDMHTMATNLKLSSCTPQPAGDYVCTFSHDYPTGYPAKLRHGKTGEAEFLVGPATTPGWYMTVFQGCG